MLITIGEKSFGASNPAIWIDVQARKSLNESSFFNSMKGKCERKIFEFFEFLELSRLKYFIWMVRDKSSLGERRGLHPFKTGFDGLGHSRWDRSADAVR